MALITITYRNVSNFLTYDIVYNDVTKTIVSTTLVSFNAFNPSYNSGEVMYSHVDGLNTWEVRALNSGSMAYVTSFVNALCTIVLVSMTPTNATTNAAANGSITILASGNLGLVTYNLTGGPDAISISNNTGVFLNLKPGWYQSTLQNFVNNVTCFSSFGIANVGFNSIVCDLVLGTVQTTLAPSATITIIDYTTSVLEPVEYRIDSGAWQASNIFTGQTAGVKSVQVRHTNFTSCIASRNVTISTGSSCDILITGTVIQGEQSKFGKNGSIAITATTTAGGLEYSKDGGVTYQSSNTFLALPPGLYTIAARDANGCVAQLIVRVPSFKIPTVDFPIANSHRMVITTGPMVSGAVQNYDNQLFSSMRFPFEKEVCRYFQLLTAVDATRVQWRSNYADHQLQLRKVSDNSLVATLLAGKTTAYMNYAVTGAATLTAGAAGFTQVYFDNGLPYYYEIGMDVTISGLVSMNGTYTIKDILPGTGAAAGLQVLLLQVTYAPVPATSACTLAGTYNIEDWEVWEVSIAWGAYPVDQYYFTISGSDPAFLPFLATSEPVDVQVSHDDTLKVEFYNTDNGFKIDYSTGVKHLLRLNARLGLPKNGGVIEGMEDSVRRYIKLKEVVTRTVDMEVWDVPFYLLEKLAVAMAHDSFIVNDIAYATEEKMETTEFEMDALMQGRAKLRQVDFNNENSTSSGLNISNTIINTNTDSDMQRFGLNTAGATITLDMQLLKEVAFVAPLPITAVKTWAFANVDNAIDIPFVQFTIGTIANQTFPANVTMALIVGDWDNATKVWTPPAVGLYKASLNYSGSVWVMEMTGPLY